MEAVLAAAKPLGFDTSHLESFSAEVALPVGTAGTAESAPVTEKRSVHPSRNTQLIVRDSPIRASCVIQSGNNSPAHYHVTPKSEITASLLKCSQASLRHWHKEPSLPISHLERRPQRTNYFFLPAADLEAMACFFFWSAELAAACFCVDFFWFALGDLSPIEDIMLTEFNLPSECLFLRRHIQCAGTRAACKRRKRTSTLERLRKHAPRQPFTTSTWR